MKINRELHKTAFLINFGIMKQYRDQVLHIHIPMQEYNWFIGTLVFTFLNSHLKQELSRHDNLEALVYLLIFPQRGVLPWLEQGCQHFSHLAIQEMKQSMGTIHDSGVPQELLSFLSYARSLFFMQKPDYDHLRTLLLPATSLTLLAKDIQMTTFLQQMTHVSADDYENNDIPR